MTTTFWERNRQLLVKILPQGHSIDATYYCGTVKKVCWAIQNKVRMSLLAQQRPTTHCPWLHRNCSSPSRGKLCSIYKINNIQFRTKGAYLLQPKMHIWNFLINLHLLKKLDCFCSYKGKLL